MIAVALGAFLLTEKPKAYVDYVNPYIGSISHLLVPAYPTVHLPNGMVRAVPLRNEYSDNALSGLPVTIAGHRGGTTFIIRPTDGSESLDGDKKYHYNLENLRPYRYQVRLDDINTDVDYAPSHQSAVYSFNFH